MPWETPQTWTSDKVLTNDDFNRIEGNQEHIKNYTAYFRLFQRRVVEMDVKTLNIGNQGYINVFPGACCSDIFNGVTRCIAHGGYSKKIDSWASGDNNGGLLPGVTLSANMWLYVFALGNTGNDSFDICIEDTAYAFRINQLMPTTLSAYNTYRRVACIKVEAVYSSTICTLYPMITQGERVYYGAEPTRQVCSIIPANNTNLQSLQFYDSTYGHLCPNGSDFDFIICGYFQRSASPVQIWSTLFPSAFSEDFSQAKLNTTQKTYTEFLINANSPYAYFRTNGGTEVLFFWVTGIIDDRRYSIGLT